jgi:hypothetical protein
MISPSASALSKKFSVLTGLPVTCVAKSRFLPSSARFVYAIYNEMPEHEIVLLRADLNLLVSLAGSMIEIPDPLAGERVGRTVLDKSIHNAIRDVLSAFSVLLSTNHRVAFKSMCTDVAYLNGYARSILNSPSTAVSFDISIEGFTGGQLSILSNH